MATELAGLGDENLSTMAHVFMKHREETCKRFYVQHWANREALRISMKCFDKFNLNISENVKKEALELRSEQMKSKMPTKSKVRRWLSKIISSIKSTFGEEYEDEEIEKHLQATEQNDDIDEMDLESGHSKSDILK